MPMPITTTTYEYGSNNNCCSDCCNLFFAPWRLADDPCSKVWLTVFMFFMTGGLNLFPMIFSAVLCCPRGRGRSYSYHQRSSYSSPHLRTSYVTTPYARNRTRVDSWFHGAFTPRSNLRGPFGFNRHSSYATAPARTLPARAYNPRVTRPVVIS